MDASYTPVDSLKPLSIMIILKYLNLANTIFYKYNSYTGYLIFILNTVHTCTYICKKNIIFTTLDI